MPSRGIRWRRARCLGGRRRCGLLSPALTRIRRSVVRPMSMPDRRQLVLPVATTIFAGRYGQSSRPPANSCAGHHLCRYTVRANSIDTRRGSRKGHYVNRAEHQPQAEHVGHQDPLQRRLTLFTPHSTQIGAAGSAWRCCWTAAAAFEPSAATAAWPAGRFAEARRLWRQHRDHAPRHQRHRQGPRVGRP